MVSNRFPVVQLQMGRCRAVVGVLGCVWVFRLLFSDWPIVLFLESLADEAVDFCFEEVDIGTLFQFGPVVFVEGVDGYAAVLSSGFEVHLYRWGVEVVHGGHLYLK